MNAHIVRECRRRLVERMIGISQCAAGSNRDLTSDGGIDVQHIGLTLEQSGGPFDDPEGVVFANPAFVEEVVLEEIEVRFRRIVRGEELRVGRNAYRRLRHLASEIRVSERAWREQKYARP